VAPSGCRGLESLFLQGWRGVPGAYQQGWCVRFTGGEVGVGHPCMLGTTTTNHKTTTATTSTATFLWQASVLFTPAEPPPPPEPEGCFTPVELLWKQDAEARGIPTTTTITNTTTTTTANKQPQQQQLQQRCSNASFSQCGSFRWSGPTP
jgi:hypothetical protein